jgi:uncharacterized protein YndB with AHSA1/START domain
MLVQNDLKIVKKVTCPISQKQMWDKWTTHEGLLTFFGLDNKIELRVGGSFEIYFLMSNPQGLRGSEGCKVISIIPYDLFSFNWNAPPEYKTIREHSHQTIVLLEFMELGIMQTSVKLTHFNWLDGDDWLEVYQYFDKAWERVLENLKRSCIEL